MSTDYFLKIEGIPGESMDDKHKEEIELESWSWGETQSGAASHGGAGGGAGKVSMQDFHFVMTINKASPNLFLHCATGKHIAKAQLTCRKAGDKPQEYMKIYFKDLLISSFQTSGANGSGMLPQEQISFNFSEIKYEYSPQKADGSLASPIVFGYDVKANKKV